MLSQGLAHVFEEPEDAPTVTPEEETEEKVQEVKAEDRSGTAISTPDKRSRVHYSTVHSDSEKGNCRRHGRRGCSGGARSGDVHHSGQREQRGEYAKTPTAKQSRDLMMPSPSLKQVNTVLKSVTPMSAPANTKREAVASIKSRKVCLYQVEKGRCGALLLCVELQDNPCIIEKEEEVTRARLNIPAPGGMGEGKGFDEVLNY
jgi:hypothetical protein